MYITINEERTTTIYGAGLVAIKRKDVHYLVEGWFLPSDGDEHCKFTYKTHDREMAWKVQCVFVTMFKEKWSDARVFLRGYAEEKLILSKSDTGYAVFVSELTNGEYKVVKAETDIEPRVITDYYPCEAWALADATSFIKDNEDVDALVVVDEEENEASTGGDLCHYNLIEEVDYDGI